MLTYIPVDATRLLAAWRSVLVCSDPFSFHSQSGTGGNQSEPLCMTATAVLLLKTLDARRR